MVKRGDTKPEGLHSYVTEPEKAMLETLANISRLHLEIKEATARIAATHASYICRAVSSAISEHHLATFGNKVLDVESSILLHDAVYVGAYNIVPLSTIVSEFAPWSRRMEWLLGATRFMEGHSTPSPERPPCSGKDILDFLQDETHTGYSDIEEMALQLMVCGQRVWMRSLASWVLYAKLPSFGADDFFVRQNPSGSNSSDQYVQETTLMPRFVRPAAAASIVAIGNALNQIQSHGQNSDTLHRSNQSVALLSRHLQLLETLPYPLNPAIFETVTWDIDQSVSQNLLSRLLPIEHIHSLLMVIHRFVLLGSGEFAISLIEHGAAKTARRSTEDALKPLRKIGRVDTVTLKDAALGTILAKTWDELIALQIDQGLDDETLTFARKILYLHGVDEQMGNNTISTWLPSPVMLGFNFATESTLVLFLDKASMDSYSSINSYLLSVRRAELQLSSLWKLTSQRRCHPTPLGPPNSATKTGKRILAMRRAREESRSVGIRQHWACANKTLFLVNELDGYLHGEVIGSSWSHFDAWIQAGANSSRPGSSPSQSSRPGTASAAAQSLNTSQTLNLPNHAQKARDPRTLAQGHQIFLTALRKSILLDDEQFVTDTKALINLIDHFVALFHRLQTVWEGLDLQEDDGVVDAFSNYIQDEESILAELVRTRELLEGALLNLVVRLNEIDKQRSKDGVTSDLGQLDLQTERFVPWQPRTMDRLIMKLDLLACGRDVIHDNGVLDGFDDD